MFTVIQMPFAMNWLTIVSLFLISSTISASTLQTKACGEWIKFQDEKCIKLLTDGGQKTFQEANATCFKEEATMVTVNSIREQEFLYDYLFDQEGLVDSVWIGGKWTNASHFEWTDGSPVVYKNMIAESNDYASTKACIQMMPFMMFFFNESSAGKWINVPCKKRNLFVCQKNQNWSMDRLQADYLIFKKEVTKSLETSLIPIGFVYTQLFGQLEPTKIWPQFTWTEVSQDFAGQFFRVVGGDAEPFGEIQSMNIPHIKKITAQTSNSGANPVELNYWNSSDTVTFNMAGPWGYNGNYRSLVFTMEQTEVRPLNQAIRLWTRVK